ncbi:MAG TPA: hypothetical protein PKZ16_00555 [bacterium]|mgnify:CR=1 FL=1|nr:hypothetical protein [bacterium]HPL95724.1 hypothetical protein [bacterium]
MLNKTKLMNYVGQIRIYSLVDLILLLIAVKADTFQFLGIIFLWLGFLLFLEAGHKHSYRLQFPKYSWLFLYLLGLFFYHAIGAFLFILFSYLYTQKNKLSLGLVSPAFRIIQTIVLLSGVIGFSGYFIWLAAILVGFRNFLGDIRDVDKDKKEGKKTIPVLLKMPTIKYIHLYGCWLTSIVWWSYTDLNFFWLILVLFIQRLTCNWTTR